MNLSLKFFFLIFLLLFPRIYFYWKYASSLFLKTQISSLSPKKYALVLGASVSKDGLVSDVLADRIEVSAMLFKQGKVEKIVLSGKTTTYEDEVSAMKNYAIILGLKEEDLILDFKGFTTRQSCQNAAKLSASADWYVVTQQFHLPRSLYFCERYGIDALGVAADQKQYPIFKKIKWQMRELIASWKAVFVV